MAGIYIHIPFCRKLCFYCDFYHVISRSNNPAFMQALLREMEIRKDYLGEESVETIYFGGGTPSIYPAKELDIVLKKIRSLFHVKEDSEITIEVNPDDVTPVYMQDLKKAGFNRVSMGIQSWRDSDLKTLNRRHDSAGAKKALDDTFAAGFGNVSIDLIYGIPGMSAAEWESNLDFSFSFDIRHISAYHLTLEEGTVFGRMREQGKIAEIEEEESAHLFEILLKKTSEAGFIQYEISNFGKSGFFSRHNSNYWKQVSYLGLGPSAHSFNGYSRQWNKNDLQGYIKAIHKGQPDFEREEIDSVRRFNEYIMISLRTLWGIDLGYIENTFGKEASDYVKSISHKFLDYGLMISNGNNLTLANNGKMISDNIITEFMMPTE